MRSLRHPLFAALLAIVLLFSQQAAFRHMLSHLQTPADVSQIQHDDIDHGTALARSDVCAKPLTHDTPKTTVAPCASSHARRRRLSACPIPRPRQSSWTQAVEKEPTVSPAKVAGSAGSKGR